MNNITDLIEPLKKLHAMIRDAVVAECEKASLEQLSEIAHESEGDTIYAVDIVSEELLIEFVKNEIAPKVPVILIAEGLANEGIVLPEGTAAEDAVWRIIVDPIDGTRCVMYQKRPSWILTGVAPNKGEQTSLQDIEFAIQTEIPLVKQHLSDMLYVTREMHAPIIERYNRITDETSPVKMAPSKSTTIAHGFAMISRFFPGVREELAAIDEEIVFAALGPVKEGKTHCFEDQYISTGGQLYELMAGHDRFVADIRPVMEKVLNERGLKMGICCHPYDICTELIARKLGVLVCDEYGNALNCPLDLDSDVSWMGFANSDIQKQIAPLMDTALKKRELI
ncbi:MAG: inositol monophosphatase [Lentisphaeria bacterium]|nr:inositol monophosphatase [Lentisphaeria bacterium]NQZ70785.1 inositol monophosphatase [Lentisphaeria bacterium]